ncbi:MAG: phosphatidate cytidylyltransferase [Candidatus Celaenobacter antarcticus]|nr:phosphatidate cytidylyltransferase [Candidatus Celaenobacter antarcticus]
MVTEIRPISHNEIYRKLTHLFAIIIPVLYYLVVKNQLLAIAILLPFAIGSVVWDSARIESPKYRHHFLKLFGSHLRDSEVSRHTGGTYLLTSSVVVIAVFSKEIAYLAISYLVVGDTFAAFVGLSMGRRKFVRSKKSLEGFIGAFVSCSVWGLLSYFLFLKRVFSYDCAHPELAVILIILGALVASVVESVDLHINDNISIPILSALAMTVIYMFI